MPASLSCLPFIAADPDGRRLFLGGSSIGAGGDMVSILFVLTSGSTTGSDSMSTTDANVQNNYYTL